MACRLYNCMCMISMPGDTDETRHAVQYMMHPELLAFSESEHAG